MIRKIPRVMIGGTGSDCGKTTVVCGLLQALVSRGYMTSSFKCGPDYIDPMFHRTVIGTCSSNLDLYLCGEEEVKYLLAAGSAGTDFAVIEGVMGIYDGLGFTDDKCSANEVSAVTGTPEILVVNVRGKSASLLAEIKGYLGFTENRIRGIILNRCPAAMYGSYRDAIEERLEIKVFGFMPSVEEVTLPSRHLGLVTAAEIGGIKEKLLRLGGVAEKYLDIDGITDLARTAPKLECKDLSPKNICGGRKVKIALARDRAFCFYYEECLDLLRCMGVEIAEFSPMDDEALPDGISGIILGGGYPELYANRLEANATMRRAVRGAADAGMPVYGECGGFMYLGADIEYDGEVREMCGVFDSHARMTKGLVRFGYKSLKAEKDCLICSAETEIRAHEFHYGDSSDCGDMFTCVNRRGQETKAFLQYKNTLAGYPHIHLFTDISTAERFVMACRNFAEENEI